jgi:hypothetical protein
MDTYRSPSRLQPWVVAIAACVRTAHAAPPELAPPPLTDLSSPDPDVRPQRNLKFLGRIQFDFGGEEIIGLRFTDGDERSLHAGQGATLSAGLMYRSSFPLAIEATVGFKLALLAPSNGNVDFTRIPLDVIVSAGGVGHRVGIGATAHFRPKLSCNVSGVCSGAVVFDTAHGLILQYAYSTQRTNRAFDLGARITLLSYAIDNETIGANSIGVFASGRL